MSNFAELLQAQGKLGDFESLLEETLVGRRAALGAKHPDTLLTERWIAQVIQQRNGGGKIK
jgi:hypothetical protein